MARSRTRSLKAPSPDIVVQTKNDLPEESRAKAITLLNARLADAMDLQSQCKQAHWNVKGPHFIALHKLFDDVYTAAGEYVDLLAERIVQLGGVAEGTVRIAAERSTLTDYPLELRSGDEHVAALSDALATFGHGMRMGVNETEELEDPGTVDILTEILRGTDEWLWFVEAHEQGAPGADREEATR